MTECAVCGLASCDLPDGIGPEDVFDTDDGETRCMGCAVNSRRRIVYNAVKCLLCGQIIESTHRHDMVWCACHSVAVDGGHEYLRRVFTDDNQWQELSRHE